MRELLLQEGGVLVAVGKGQLMQFAGGHTDHLEQELGDDHLRRRRPQVAAEFRRRHRHGRLHRRV